MPVPFLGRLSLADYRRILLTFLILAGETVLRAFVYLLPVSLLDWLRYHMITNVYPRVFRGWHDEDIGEGKNPFVGATSTADLVRAHGYGLEEHTVFTEDGYLLVIHRIKHKDREEDPTGPPVLLMHGCMMSSEVWVCLRSRQKCLPLVLLEAGYDVWLGNVRGNKYCQKHRKWKPSQVEFWDFSLDELVLQDVPAMVDYVLKATESKYQTISYVGFSQGSTIGFGALSLLPELNGKINLMIALAATTKPKGMNNRLVQALTKATPELIYLFFSRHIFLSAVRFWRRIMAPRAYTIAIDMCLKALFGWECKHMRPLDKIIAYQHLYASTSTKTIVHWFQVMQAGRLQMYDDKISAGGCVVPRFTLDAIKTPVALFLGGRDTLVDNGYTKSHLNSCLVHDCLVPEYEHLDFLWADDLDVKVFPQILQLLGRY